MQVRDSDTRLLYGLFQGISTWAMEKGYKDISGMKNLLKLAMVDTCRQRHEDKSSFAAQMAIVTDLGISLRNVQYTLKMLEELRDRSSDYVQIRELQKEITIVLGREPQTLDELLAEISYLIHAPHDLQKRTLRTIMKDMEQKGIVTTVREDGIDYYRTEKAHVNLLDTADLATRISGMLTHINDVNHTVGQPLFKTYQLNEEKARELQIAINEFLRGTGNAYEADCRENEAVTKPHYFYYGSTKILPSSAPTALHEVLLKCIFERFNDPDSASILRSHWYHLTPTTAKIVFNEVSEFVEREGVQAGAEIQPSESEPFAFYFGLADRNPANIEEEI